MTKPERQEHIFLPQRIIRSWNILTRIEETVVNILKYLNKNSYSSTSSRRGREEKEGIRWVKGEKTMLPRFPWAGWNNRVGKSRIQLERCVTWGYNVCHEAQDTWLQLTYWLCGEGRAWGRVWK